MRAPGDNDPRGATRRPPPGTLKTLAADASTAPTRGKVRTIPMRAEKRPSLRATPVMVGLRCRVLVRSEICGATPGRRAARARRPWAFSATWDSVGEVAGAGCVDVEVRHVGAVGQPVPDGAGHA